MNNGLIKPLGSPILIVDDDEAQLKSLADILEMEDLYPICCQTGQMALDSCRKQEINVAILDLRLPDMDGLQVLQSLKELNPEIKVIINTGYASLETAMEAINQEVFAYVSKMGDVEELLASVHRAFYVHIARHNELLEREVNKRTEELSRANEELKNEIAERQRVEEELRQAQKMEAIGRLAGGIAHDFNNILTVIIGNCDLVLDSLSPNDLLRRDITQIKKAGERAASLTRQLLAFSRQQVLQPVVLSLNTVAANLENLLRRLIGEDIELEIKLDPNLGNIRADPGQMEQVIMNLVVNARDAMPEGGALTIETANVDLDEANFRNVEPGPYVMLAISDTGIGIDVGIEAHIFEPFFTTKGQGQGTGLGLATVYGIVYQSDGHISVYSEPGQGTMFRIHFPQVKEGLTEPVPCREIPVPKLQETATILLVEDEEMVR
jgi:signal transduction histidine kinase